MSKGLKDMRYVDYDVVTLDKIRQRLQLRFGERQVQQLGLEIFMDQMQRELVVRMERWFVGQHMPDHTFTKTEKVTVAVSVPANWRQAFKYENAHRWWMRWMVRKWPVQYKAWKGSKDVTTTQQCAFDVLYPDFVPPYGFEREQKIIVPRIRP